MTTKLLKVNGAEHPAEFIRFRENDFTHGRRSTVTILTRKSYAEVLELFSNPGDWSVIERNEKSPELNTEIDCTDYCKLLNIKDTRTGVLEVVMSKMTDSEVLAELLEELNDEA